MTLPSPVGIVASGVGAQGTGIQDTFTRANATGLGYTEAPNSTQWLYNAAGAWSIASNQAANPTGAGTCWAYVAAPSANMVVQATPIGTVGQWGYPDIRARINGTTYYWASLQFVVGQYSLYVGRVLSGSNTWIRNGVVNEWQHGDTVALSAVEESGSTRVRLFINGNQIASVLDSAGTRPTGLGAGIGCTDHPGFTFDNFSVEEA